MSEIKANRTRNLRYKRPALATMGWQSIWDELDAIGEACADIHWFVDQDDETLLNALDGDEDEVWEFKMAFADLEARADQLAEALREQFGRGRSDDPDRDFDDCTVALVGNRYRMIGLYGEGGMEEDYYSLTASDRGRKAVDAEDQVRHAFHHWAVCRYLDRVPGPTAELRLSQGHVRYSAG